MYVYWVAFGDTELEWCGAEPPDPDDELSRLADDAASHGVETSLTIEISRCAEGKPTIRPGTQAPNVDDWESMASRRVEGLEGRLATFATDSGSWARP